MSHLNETKERRMIGFCYGVSLVATLYSSWYMRSYFLTIICVVVQVVALLYFLLSYVGGTHILSYALQWLGLAVAALIMYLIARLRGRRRHQPDA